MEDHTVVGLDVHARSIVGYAINVGTGEVFRQRLGGEPGPVVTWILGLPGPVTACYEAGPTGYGLARMLIEAGVECVVAAPSKLLRQPGDRVKTDARDAEHLAGLLATGLVTSVRIPDVEEEAVRDVLRAREDARGDLMRARHRVSKFLLRHGIVYPGDTTWNTTHLRWLRGQHFDLAAIQSTFDTDLAAVLEVQARRDDLDHQIHELVVTSPHKPIVDALMCLRGVGEVTAFGLTMEIGDWTRFTGATIGSYVGLVGFAEGLVDSVFVLNYPANW